MFHNLKKDEAHLIMLKLGKFGFKTNVIPNEIEKYISFSIHNKFIYLFLSSSIDILVKNLDENGFKHLGQEFDSGVLDLIRQKGIYLYEYMSSFKTFNEK